MAEITAALVKELREKTGAGMMDCKKALGAVGGDLEEAVDWLRKKGLAAAAKRAGRVAAEGLVGVAAEGRRGAVVEVNAETDFIARNETFQGFVAAVARLALESGADVKTLRAAVFPGSGHTVADELTGLIAKIGENMTVRRAARLTVPQGVVSTYAHNEVAAGTGLGKTGVLVGLDSSAEPDKLAELGRQLAMHVAWADPRAVDKEDLDPALLERERAVLSEQARASGKPENIIGKMVEGRLRKFYEEVCLLDQGFVMDQETKVRQVLERAGKDLGAPVRIAGFTRFKLGEGIEREQTDFAAEVAAQLGG